MKVISRLGCLAAVLLLVTAVAAIAENPAPLFHAASRKICQEIYERCQDFIATFRDGAARLRLGEPENVSPEGSLPPAAPWAAG
jgi:hypothetical protein